LKLEAGMQIETDLTGKLLIALPGIGDARFERSVILLCAHTPEFAMGIVLNKPVEGVDLQDVTQGEEGGRARISL
jgi:putative transcriptional regulator